LKRADIKILLPAERYAKFVWQSNYYWCKDKEIEAVELYALKNRDGYSEAAHENAQRPTTFLSR
jgi:hypothetical protein